MYYGTPPIVTDGLVVNLDAANTLSLPSPPGNNLTRSPFIITGSAYASDNEWTDPTSSFNKTYDPNIVTPLGTGATLLSEKGEVGRFALSRWGGGGFGNYYLSCYLYPLTSSLTWQIGKLGDGTLISFNLTTKVITSSSFYNGFQSFIEDVPGYPGWLRVGANFRGRGGGWVGAMGYNIVNNYTGSAGAKQIYITGVQYQISPYVTNFTTSNSASWTSVPSLPNSSANLLSGASGTIPITQFTSVNERVLNFDGTGSYARASRIITGSSYTVEVTFNADAVPLGVEKWLVSQYPGSDRVIFDIFTNNTLRNFMGNGTNPSSAAIYSTTVIEPGKWYYATFTKDTLGTGSLYVNGVRESVGPLSLGAAPNVPLEIGGSTTLTRWFDGKISFVRIYNRELTQQEITQNFNAIKGRFGLQ